MNRYTVVTLISCIVIAQGAFVSAQTTTPGTTTEAVVQPVIPETKRPFVTEPSLQKVAQTRLRNLAANMSNRMDSAVSRLQNVVGRLNSRLDKMSEAGMDVSKARAELTLAQTKLDEVKRNLENIDTEVNAFIGSANPRENWTNLKNTYTATGAAIVAAHQSILTTINLAKNSIADTAPATSTTTASSTNN